jgi:hypothetical protein
VVNEGRYTTFIHHSSPAYNLIVKGHDSPESGGARPDSDIEQVIDHLFSLPLSEFTEARNTAAKELRTRGRKDAAHTVSRLPKPVLSAWAVNQLARTHADQLEDLAAITAAASDATDAAELREAGLRRRRAIANLVGLAKDILENSGHAATPATLERISRTLQASSDQQRNSMLVAGRLTQDLEPGGMDFLAAMPQAAAGPASDIDRDERSRAAQQMRRRVEEAELKATELTRAAEEAEARARALADQAADARREARRAREEEADLKRGAR